MASLEDMIRSAVPDGNIAKPLMLALVGLLASGALFGSGGTGSSGASSSAQSTCDSCLVGRTVFFRREANDWGVWG